MELKTKAGTPVRVGSVVADKDGAEYRVEDITATALHVVTTGTPRRQRKLKPADLGLVITTATPDKAKFDLARRKLRDYWEN